jgi:putative MFS transporter
MNEALSPDQVAARLDRLPVGPFHYRFLALVSLGAWFDYYDNFVAAIPVVKLRTAQVIPPTETGEWLSVEGLFMASLPLGMFLGTITFGLTSDYLGRRFGFVLMLLLYSLASLVGGAGYYPLQNWAGTEAALALLLITRVLAGAGIGAENIIIDTYVSEIVPRQVRGRCVAVVQVVAFTAFPAAFLLAEVVADVDWWLLLVIGSLGALFTWYFRRRLPESPRWLAAAGRPEEAAAVLRAIEAAAGTDSERPFTPPASGRASIPRTPFLELWLPRYRGRTIVLVVFQFLQTIGYYGFMHWVARLVQVKGFSTDEVFGLLAMPALLAPKGPLVGVWTSEHWQRKWLIVFLAAATAILLAAFGLVLQPILLALLAAALIVCLNWFSTVFHAYQAELFPTTARATGVGFTYAWSRASMVALNLVMPSLIVTSLPGAFGLMGGAMVGVAGFIGCFGPLTNARPLEESADA